MINLTMNSSDIEPGFVVMGQLAPAMDFTPLENLTEGITFEGNLKASKTVQVKGVQKIVVVDLVINPD